MALSKALAVLAALVLAASSALGARILLQSPEDSSTSTTEPATYLEAASTLSAAAAASADECAQSCLSSATCRVWAWCPANETSGCPIYYGSIGPTDPAPTAPSTLKAGACQLSTDASDGLFSIFASRGPKVPFTSGVVRRVVAAPVEPPDPTKNATAPPPAASSGIISFLPVVDDDCLLTCKQAGRGALDFGDPAQQICAIAVRGRDFWGVHASATKACEYSAKGTGGVLAEQGKAETAQGATQPAYSCACIAEEDRKKAEWKEALTCPAGYEPLDKAINVCRVDAGKQGKTLSVGWIETDTCYFKTVVWHYRDHDTAVGLGADAYLAILCLQA